MSWYALFVTTGKEELVQKWFSIYFSDSVLVSLIPRRRITERKGGMENSVIRKLFPGYILFRTNMNTGIYYKLKSIPGVIQILRTGEYFTEIVEEEMYYILRLLDSDGVVDYSKIYIHNSKVIIKSGPLKGLEGLVISIDKRKNRVRIMMNFMGFPKKIDLGVEVL